MSVFKSSAACPGCLPRISLCYLPGVGIGVFLLRPRLNAVLHCIHCSQFDKITKETCRGNSPKRK